LPTLNWCFARVFSYSISETTYLCFYFCVRYRRIVRDLTILALTVDVAVSASPYLPIESVRVFTNKLFLYEINKDSRCSILLSTSKLWSKSKNENMLDNNIRMRFRIRCAIAWISRFQHTAHIVAYVSHSFFNNPHRVTWLVLGRSGTGSLYIREGIGALSVAIVFAFRHLFVYNDCNKIFQTLH